MIEVNMGHGISVYIKIYNSIDNKLYINKFISGIGWWSV